MPSFYIAMFLFVGQGQAQESPVDALPKLQPVFGDDFSTDTRPDYRITGEVSWEKGQLTLAEGALITRQINGGAWAKVILRLAPVEAAPGSEVREVRLWFMLKGASDCFVRLRTGRSGEESPTY